jgi:hypothetical protein
MHLRVKEKKKNDSEDEENRWLLNYDVFVTILRRKFIPPLMESFQDIIVQSKKWHKYRQINERDIEELPESDLDEVMQKFF